MITEPSTKAAVAAIPAFISGAAIAGYGFFHSGHMPTPAQVTALATGGTVILGSVGAFLAAHVRLTKAKLEHPAPAPVVKPQPPVATPETPLPPAAAATA